MSKHKKDHEDNQQDGATGTKPVETYYDDDKSSDSSRSFNPVNAVCGILGGLRDSVLKTLPVDVTEHLVNGEKEILKAGIALAESQMRTADGVLDRARDLRKEKDEE